jgi:SLT domain-containing protein
VGIAAAVGGSGQATGTPATSAQVQQWIAQAEQIMATHGHPAFTPSDTADLIIIIQGESGGNPNTINTWDSNAAAGHPSQGLMQTIPSVFATYALRPGYDTNIDDPVSNIIAGTRYAEATYGSLDNVPGVIAVHAGRKYVGY